MQDRDQEYYRHRAETELRLAQNATDPAVVRAHCELLEHYLDRLDPGKSAKLRLIPTEGEDDLAQNAECSPLYRINQSIW